MIAEAIKSELEKIAWKSDGGYGEYTVELRDQKVWTTDHILRFQVIERRDDIRIEVQDDRRAIRNMSREFTLPKDGEKAVSVVRSAWAYFCEVLDKYKGCGYAVSKVL